MSIFSKIKPKEDDKSKQKPNGNAKTNGNQPYRAAGKNGASASVPNVPATNAERTMHRMAIQAESRRRMNSETPDYSIKSTAVLPPPPSTSRPRQSSQGSNRNGAARPGGTGVVSQPGPTAKLQKSSRDLSGSKSLQNIQPRPPRDRENQKMRMSPQDRSHATPQPQQQISQDSGYGSVATSSTTNSRTPSDANAPPQESDAARRQRKSNASMPPQSTYDDPLRAPANRQQRESNITGIKPASPTPDRQNSVSSGYVSKWDPGPRSAFIGDVSQPATSTVKEAKPHPAAVAAAVVAAETKYDVPAKPVAQPIETVKPQSRLQGLTKAVSMRTGKRESRNQLQPIKTDNQPVKAQSQANLQYTQSMNLPEARDPGRRISQNSVKGPKDGDFKAIPYTATETQAQKSAPRSSRNSIVMQEQPIERESRRASISKEAGLSATAPGPSFAPAARNSRSNSQASSRMDYVTPLEHPSQAKRDSTSTSTDQAQHHYSSLEGYRVNRRGQILDEEGDMIGELTQGEIIHCVRQIVNANGDVIDENGLIVGHAKEVPRTQLPSDRRESVASVVANQASIVSPITPAQPTTRPFERQPRSTTPSQHPEQGVFYVELDASKEAQATPLVDHSEIFIPPFGSQNRSHSMPSEERRSSIADQRRGSTFEQRRASRASQNTNSEESLWSSARDQSPRKGYSRYFETKIVEGPPPPRPASQVVEDTEWSVLQTRSKSMVAIPDATGGLRAVLGPTQDSFEGGIRGRSQSFSSSKMPVTSDMEAADVVSDTLPRPRGRVPSQEWSDSSFGAAYGGAFGASNGKTSRRASTRTVGSVNSRLNTKSTYHAPFVKSPLSSIANTPPDTAQGNSGDGVPMGIMRTASTRPDILQRQLSAGSDSAAPAPIIKKATPSVASSTSKWKRKSFFGISLGKKQRAA